MDAHQVIGTEQGFILHAAQELDGIRIPFTAQLAYRLEQAPGDHRELLRVEVGGEAQVREVLAVVSSGIIPAAMDIHHFSGGVALEGHAAIGSIVSPRAAHGFKIGNHIRERLAFKYLGLDQEGG